MNDETMERASQLMNSSLPGDVQLGIDIVKHLFEKADPLAVYAMGTWHLHGAHGFPLNQERGVELIAMAAKRGVVDAVCDYAYSLEQGVGIEKSRHEALGYYLLATLLGDPDALHDLARCFDDGIGIRRNKELAGLLFELYGKRNG